MRKKVIPEAFHPGEYLRDEIEARGWSPSDLAEILGIENNVVSDLFVGRRSISPELAKSLGEALGTSAQLWLNLLSAYKLAAAESPDDTVARKAKLYSLAPIREMQKRHWIEESSNIKVLETQVCQFFKIKSPDERIRLAHAARKSDDHGKVTNPQLAWLAQAKNLAKRIVKIPKYDLSKFQHLLNELSALKMEPESVALIPDLLSQYGIRFLVMEHLPKTKIDGACFWLDNVSPVIVVSLRYDRIDYFWFTIVHELMHIKKRDGTKILLVETALVGEDAQPDNEKPVVEKTADELARRFLIDQDQLQDFILRHDPFFSKKAIMSFARLNGVHPGIVVGQLHYMGKVPYGHFRPLLVKVRDIITSTALSDGWGNIVTA